ncbi:MULTISPECIES: cytochrome P450 [Streptomyces]|jgi:biflaviolin synthase|uniref:cytochrome P450 n=1 Tax=Streptomyces TaxID=1883 RepID=UPI000F73C893|nr:cytochrome P450 [Streptomyces sp. WAC05292]RSS82148.1 cytochrome P450 [Streptomyces sp. WAC05292]
MLKDGPATARPPVTHWPTPALEGVDFDPVLAGLMQAGPVTRIRLPNGSGWAWLVCRYDDVRMVANDPRFSRKLVAEHDVTRLAPHFIPAPGAVGFEDPPDHTRLRRTVAAAFTTTGVERLRTRAKEMLDGFVDGILADGPPADLTERLLAPFPLAVVCELMGVPEQDRPVVHEWTTLILSSAQGAERSERAKNEALAYLAARLRSGDVPHDDSVIGLLDKAVRDGEVTLEEATGLGLLIQIGGEAVTNNVGNMVYILLTRPDLMDRLRDRPELRPSGLNELLRYIPHRNAVGLSRIALEDVVVAGQLIRAGEAVYVSYLAANRDPDVFPDPDELHLDRSPNPHVSFGYGPHFCPGAMLARLESELMVDALLDRFQDLRFTVPTAELRWRPGALIRGPEGLPVTWS